MPRKASGWWIWIGIVLSGIACTPAPQQALGTADRAIRVAAIGNSITYGHGIEDREHNSYPAQLGRLLGEGYAVRNFGVSGRTMLKHGDFPYWNEQDFQEALAWEPDVVVIKLGTNDTKPQNWHYRDEFVADYEAMIDVFAALPSKPTIWICYPVPAFEERFSIRASVISEEVIPMIDQIAAHKQVSIIDLYDALDGRGDLFPDGIHPNTEGAGLIAEAVAEVIAGSRTE
jgi:acyl-CoA thioesterase-1